MTTGERMKSRRKEIGLSAERVAEMLGVSPATIYRYENGDIDKVPGDRLAPIAQALSTTPAYLLGWSDDKKITPDEPELTEGEREWVELFRQLSDDQRQMIRGMMRGIVNEINNER